MFTAHAVGSFEQKFSLSETETEENKVCICNSGVQVLEFRDAFESDAEISELWSIEWLGIFFFIILRQN